MDLEQIYILKLTLEKGIKKFKYRISTLNVLFKTFILYIELKT